MRTRFELQYYGSPATYSLAALVFWCCSASTPASLMSPNMVMKCAQSQAQIRLGKCSQCAGTLALANHNLFKNIPICLQVILCADGSITLTVMSCNPDKGTVVARCENTAMLGERKNVNLPGVIVDLPTVTPKVRSLED